MIGAVVTLRTVTHSHPRWIMARHRVDHASAPVRSCSATPVGSWPRGRSWSPGDLAPAGLRHGRLLGGIAIGSSPDRVRVTLRIPHPIASKTGLFPGQK